MVVELSLIFADLPNQTMDEQKVEMSLKASGFIRSDGNVRFGSIADVSAFCQKRTSWTITRLGIGDRGFNRQNDLE
jgi:hypothetical protein